MRVLVTGATGFIGAHLVSVLAQAGDEVVAVHHGALDAERVSQMGMARSAAVTFRESDVRDEVRMERLIESERPTHIVHTAAITPDVERERRDSRLIVETNELSVLTLLSAAAHHGVERFVYLSSAAVYAGAGLDRAVDETAPLCEPCGLYAVTKLGGERLCRWAASRLGIDTLSVRLGPVYGQFERVSRSRPNVSAVCRGVELALAGEPLRCHVPHLSQDWIHGDDVARGIGLLLAAPSLPHHVYNLAGPSVRMSRLLQVIGDAIPHTRVEWVDAPDQANVPAPSASARGPLDSRRLEVDTGFQPMFTIASGIQQYMADLTNRSGSVETRGERGAQRGVAVAEHCVTGRSH